MKLFRFRDHDELKKAHRSWVEETLKEARLAREEYWTESVAVGSQEFVSGIKQELLERGIGKKIIKGVRICTLQESRFSYPEFFRSKK